MTYSNKRLKQTISDFSHQWVTVVNPLNRRMLLQACDDCGVVKSENSIVKRCKAAKGSAVISQSLNPTQQLAV